jgi:hypothetical protein
MKCAFCGKPLAIKSAWKGAGDAFYCNEFCADSEIYETASANCSLVQLHLNDPYERLRRLLPYMRRYSGHTLPDTRR